MRNLFPGMNPWLEEYWRDVHASALVYMRDALNAELPPGLHARIDERLAIDTEDDEPHRYLPDVAITEPWDRPTEPARGPGGASATVSEPIVVELEPQKIRRLEIVDSRSNVVTTIELLSPSNKDEFEHRAAWHRKRADYLAAGINLVEIDLLRSGAWTLPDRSLLKPLPSGRVYYHICVTRAFHPRRHEFYIASLRDRLPTIRVPLRRTDPDVALDLQSLIDQTYERGRYATVIDYNKGPQPPLPEEEAAWAKKLAGQGA